MSFQEFIHNWKVHMWNHLKEGTSKCKVFSITREKNQDVYLSKLFICIKMYIIWGFLQLLWTCMKIFIKVWSLQNENQTQAGEQPAYLCCGNAEQGNWGWSVWKGIRPTAVKPRHGSRMTWANRSSVMAVKILLD